MSKHSFRPGLNIICREHKHLRALAKAGVKRFEDSIEDMKLPCIVAVDRNMNGTRFEIEDGLTAVEFDNVILPA